MGSDGDLVIWDQAKLHVVDKQHGNTDVSSFEGFHLLGMPELTVQRGRVIVEDGQLLGKAWARRVLARQPDHIRLRTQGL